MYYNNKKKLYGTEFCNYIKFNSSRFYAEKDFARALSIICINLYILTILKVTQEWQSWICNCESYKYFIPRFHGLRVVQLRRTIKLYIAHNDIARGAKSNSLSLSQAVCCQKRVTVTRDYESHPTDPINVIIRSNPRKMHLYYYHRKKFAFVFIAMFEIWIILSTLKENFETDVSLL